MMQDLGAKTHPLQSIMLEVVRNNADHLAKKADNLTCKMVGNGGMVQIQLLDKSPITDVDAQVASTA